jgi:hypothetical protein
MQIIIASIEQETRQLVLMSAGTLVKTCTDSDRAAKWRLRNFCQEVAV